MKTQRIFYFLLLTVPSFLISCSDQNSLVLPELRQGKFVVDSLGCKIVLKKHSNDSVYHFVDYGFKYHFEYVPGYLSSIDFRAGDSLGVHASIDYSTPIPVNETSSYKDGLCLMKRLNTGEPVNVILELKGIFANEFARSGDMNKFSVTKVQTLLVPK